MNYREEARKLVANLNQSMGASTYDTAWLARLQQPGEYGPIWPDLLDWLVEHQLPDGSWGGMIPYYHDRIICTLAAIIALHLNRHDGAADKAIRRAEHYLWHNLHLLHRDPFELVGFELLFPTLLADAQLVGLDVPQHTCGYGQMQAEKLRLIPPQMLYSPRISTVHSLEFLGQTGDVSKMVNSLAANGSLGNSPAATAYYLTLCSETDARAMTYLEQVRQHREEVIYLYPFRTFELTWVLNNLAFSGVSVTEFAGDNIWQTLQTELTSGGIGLDRTFGIPDGDITSVTARLLMLAGYDVDPQLLVQFEDKKTHVFRTYEYERNISVGTNLHAMEALELMPGSYPNRYEVVEEIIIKLLDNRVFNIYWIDKWHASPYYATSHVLAGLLRGDSYLVYVCQNTVNWLLHTQRTDGSWGFFEEGTAEETAYVLTALLFYYQHDRIDSDILHRAAAYLAREYEESGGQYPELWIGKSLYVPHDVVRSAILAALILYEETFGRSPER